MVWIVDHYGTMIDMCIKHWDILLTTYCYHRARTILQWFSITLMLILHSVRITLFIAYTPLFAHGNLAPETIAYHKRWSEDGNTFYCWYSNMPSTLHEKKLLCKVLTGHITNWATHSICANSSTNITIQFMYTFISI